MVLLFLFGRNPKLVDIPNLANVLKFISELKPKKPCFDEHKLLDLVFKEDRVGDGEVDQAKPEKFALKQDLNCLPDSETESEESEDDQTEQSESGISSYPTCFSFFKSAKSSLVLKCIVIVQMLGQRYLRRGGHHPNMLLDFA